MKSSIATLLAFTRLVSALNPVLVKGNVFYDTVTNERVFLHGVDYQPLGELGIDPLVDPEACARDLFLMQQLGVNVMRVYTVDASKNHDECMSMYNAGGIYLMLDVNAGRPGHYLNRDTPWITYNKEYVTNVFTTMTVFSGYSNVIGYFIGNELINAKTSAMTSPPYLKALVRDMKAYSLAHLDGPVTIGYSAADNIDFRVETATYMSCGTGADGKNDFYAINSYQFCGQQTLHTSGYDQLIEQFSKFTIPLFFSEIGCNALKRTFQETDFVFGPDMTLKFSGCLVYEWTQEANNYGLLKLSPSGDIKLLPDYDALRGQYAKISNLPKEVPKQNAEPLACPPESSYKYINGSASLPSLDEVEEVIKNGVSATPGKLTDVKLFATKYSITDSRGREITDKLPQKVSGLSHVDLKDKMREPGYAADAASASASTHLTTTSLGLTNGTSKDGGVKSSLASPLSGGRHSVLLVAVLACTATCVSFLL